MNRNSPNFTPGPDGTPRHDPGSGGTDFDAAGEGAYPQRSPCRRLDVADEALGLKAALVVDAEIGGRSCGGLRLLPQIRIEELQDLARTMTLKQVYVGSARGGARAAIVCPPEASADRRQELINRFGELIAADLEGRKYLCARDIGSTAAQIQAMYAHVGMQQQVKPRSGTRSGYLTAVSVLASIERSLAWGGRTLEGSRIVVEGFGKVGQALCGLLTERGAKLVAVSDLGGAVTDERGLSTASLLECWDPDARSWKPGAGGLEGSAVAATVPADVFAPCADHYTVHSGNAPALAARLIVAGANNAVTAEAERILWDRGVTYLPDFITNAGGVLGNMLEFAGLGERHLRSILRDRICVDLDSLQRDAQARGLPPRVVAIDLVERKLAGMQQRAGTAPGQRNRRVTAVAAGLFNSPLFPRTLFSPLLYRRIKNGVGLN